MLLLLPLNSINHVAYGAVGDYVGVGLRGTCPASPLFWLEKKCSLPCSLRCAFMFIDSESNEKLRGRSSSRPVF